jgi:serine/threonine protein phosphatase PrpC
MLEDFALKEIVTRKGYVELRAQALVEEANHHGGTDNITALLIDLRGGTN